MAEYNTFEDAIKVAISKEEDAVEFYVKAVEIIKSPEANKMCSEFINEEKKHVELLEKALSNTSTASVGKKKLPSSMDITKYLTGDKITQSSTPQDVMIIAMKKESSAVEFYSEMISVFSGTNLEELFQSLCAMEKEHKDHLEVEYEKNFMPDN